MTKTITELPPGDYIESDLEAALDTFTNSELRRKKARNVFVTKVDAGNPAKEALEAALLTAINGMSDPKSKLKNARTDAQISLIKRRAANSSDDVKVILTYHQPTSADINDDVQTPPDDGLSWGYYSSGENPNKAVIGALIGLVTAVIIMVLSFSWLLSIYTKSPNQGITGICILLSFVAFGFFCTTLGWLIGIRLTTTEQTKSSETSTTTTTTSA